MMRQSQPRNLLLVLSMLAATCAYGQQAAQFAPADANVYLEVNDLAQLRKDWVNDPLVAYLRKNLFNQAVAPPNFKQAAKVWANAKKALGMTGDQIVDRYFGQSVALVFNKQGDAAPGMIISKVAEADATLAMNRLNFARTGTLDAGQGAFTLYQSDDNKAHVAIGRGWVIVADPKFDGVVRDTLTGKQKTLADDAVFKQWVGKLPSKRAATAFLRLNGEKDIHVLGVVRNGRDLSLEYAGANPEFAKLFALMGGGGAKEFGPLPDSTMAAVTLNLFDPNMKVGPGVQWLFPGKDANAVKKDIIGQIEAPVVLFFGEVPGDRFAPNAGVNVPAIGVALKLKEHDVADDLTAAINALTVVANIQVMNWNRQQTDAPPLPPIAVRSTAHRGTSFRVADLGATLAARAKRDELKHLNLAYGRIGDWYVVCSQDKFFTQCIDADKDSSKSLKATHDFSVMPLTSAERPIATAIVRPGPLSKHVKLWLNRWQEVRPNVVAAAKAPNPGSGEARLFKVLMIASEVIEHYQSISLQARREPDGDAIRARIDIIRKPATSDDN